MARPASNPKQSTMQLLLWMVMIFMGINLFMGSKNQTAPTFGDKVLKTPDETLVAMREANKKVLDITIAHTLLPTYEKQLKEQVESKKLTVAEEDRLKIQAAVIVADTQLRGGLKLNDSNRVRSAYQSLQGYERKHLKDPVWNEPFEVADGQYSGHELHQKVVETLTARNKVDLIWGFLPGGYQLIDTLVAATGRVPGFSYAFAGFLLALCVRAIIFPLAQKQIMFGRQMSQLGPRVSEIKERYKDNPAEQNVKVMELYREYGINPMAGCFPALIQMPLFLTVYQCMLHYQFAFQQGHFLWINPETSAKSGGFIGANLGQNDYILVVIYGISMIVTTLLTPVSDPTQQKQQRLLGVGVAVFFTFLMLVGPIPVVSGFVLYWTFTNILSTLQALRAYRLPMPVLAKVNAPGGGVYPKSGIQGKWAQMIDQMQVAQEEAARKQLEASKDKDKFISNGPDKNGSPSSNGKHTPTLDDKPKDKGDQKPKHKPKKRN